MSIKVLPDDVKELIRSSTRIQSIFQCISELVLNSLDANSTALAVRINLISFKIQILDNGEGINKDDIVHIGERHMTTKCHTINTLKSKPKYFGFKGESLANIKNISKKMIIISRGRDSDETYRTTIEGETKSTELCYRRSSSGTTIIIEDLLFNLPVRRNRIKINYDLEQIKKYIESLSIIHPNVSFSLRNDITGVIIFQTKKCSTVLEVIKYLHPNLEIEISRFKITKNTVKVSGILSKNLVAVNKLQLVYLNKRPIHNLEIVKYINDKLSKNEYYQKSNQKYMYPGFVINIQCPLHEVDIILESTSINVVFKNEKLIFKCLDEWIETFLKIRTNKLPLGSKSRKRKIENDLEDNNSVDVIESSKINVGESAGREIRKEIIEKINKQAVNSSKRKKEIVNKKNLKGNKKNNCKIRKKTKENYLDCETKAEMYLNNIMSEFVSKNKVENLQSVSNQNNEKRNGITNLTFNKNNCSPSGKSILMDIFIKSLEVYSHKNKSNNTNNVIKNEETSNFVNELSRFSILNNKSVKVSINIPKKLIKNNIINGTLINAKHSNIISGENFVLNREEKFDTIRNFMEKSTICRINKTLKHIQTSFVKSKHRKYKSSIATKTDLLNKSNYLKSISVMNSENFTGKVCINDATFDSHQCNFHKKAKENKNYKGYYSEGDNYIFNNKRLDEKLCSFSIQIPNYDEFERELNERMLLSRRSDKKSSFGRIEPYSMRDQDKVVKNYFRRSCDAFEGTLSKLDRQGKRFSNWDSYHLQSVKMELNQTKFFCNSIETSKVLSDLKTLNLFNNDSGQKKTPERSGEWIEIQNVIGKQIYLNKKSGFTSFLPPIADKTPFKLKKRIEIIPKGLSPILSCKNVVNESLSPLSKENLHKKIYELYEDDLKTVKWEQYLKSKDPKSFFDLIYKQLNKTDLSKRKLLEGKQNFKNFTLSNKIDKTIFTSLQVIGQLDSKFIIGFLKCTGYIFIFDQHAVHERIRLESLYKQYGITGRFYTTKLKQNVVLKLDHNELNIFSLHGETFEKWGFGYRISESYLEIFKVPTCFYDRISKESLDEKALSRLISQVIKNEIEELSLDRNPMRRIPNFIRNLLSSEACRGDDLLQLNLSAVKFGNKLFLDECSNLINMLARCDLPFQCAHGRPTTIPLLNLNVKNNNNNTLIGRRPNLKKLLR